MLRLNSADDRARIEAIIGSKKFDFDDDIYKTAKSIVDNVKKNGDKALLEYTEKFDKVKLDSLAVSEDEIAEAYENVDDKFLQALRESIKNVSDFHRKQIRQNWFDYQGGMTGQLINPLQRIGAYAPGGRAPYPSSAVMTIVPARTAGVEEIVVVSPPGKDGRLNPHTLVAMKESGADEIYKAGGAQAIAALAYGTETIKPVDKIVGPGNIYVTLAKKQVYGIVDIDMLAGPSEVLVLADSTARPDFIAADLLSQAEHDPMAVPVLITDDCDIMDKVEKELQKQLPVLEKSDIARQSLEDNGLFILVDNIKEGIDYANKFAPEHFELVVEEPLQYLAKIKNAGAVFIGEYSSEPLGDYLAGPNHVLPTSGTARYASPLNTDDFLKKSSIIYYQRDELAQVKDSVIELAELEGFTAHAGAVKKRFEDK